MTAANPTLQQQLELAAAAVALKDPSRPFHLEATGPCRHDQPVSDAAAACLATLGTGHPLRTYTLMLAAVSLNQSVFTAQTRVCTWAPGVASGPLPRPWSLDIGDSGTVRDLLNQTKQMLSQGQQVMAAATAVTSTQPEISANLALFAQGVHDPAAHDALIQRFPLVAVFNACQAVTEVQWHYDPAVFSADFVAAVAANLDLVLAQCGDLNRAHTSFTWQTTADPTTLTPAASFPTAIAEFEARVAETPDQVALRCENETLTYAELNQYANRFAQMLRSRHGIGRGDWVCLPARTSIDTLISIFGILKSGAAYAPLSPDYPDTRLVQLLGEADFSLIIADGDQVPRLEALAQSIPLLEQPDHRATPAGNLPNPVIAGRGDDPIYLLYTSGSTGKPKGVVNTHAGVVRLVRHADFVPYSRDTVTLLLAPLTFDASTFDIWGALLNGGTCVLYPHAMPQVHLIGETMAAYGVNTTFLTAALFNAVVDEDVQALRPMRHLLVGGEALSPTHVIRAQQHLPDTQLYNGYGPTEATTFTAVYRIPTPWPDVTRALPIGSPIGQTACHVVDAADRLLPPFAPGELLIAGPGLARGYHGNQKLTDAKFITTPWSNGERLYRSGDRVMWDAHQTLWFFGRGDDQVKVRGFRIELGEITVHLNEIAGVRQSAVRVIGENASDKQLAAYVALQAGTSETQVRETLAARLPDYMVPTRWMVLDELPRNSSGKVDLRALPGFDQPNHAGTPQNRAQSAQEQLIAAAWCRVLGLGEANATTLNIDDNFFAIGGDSIRAIQVLAQLKKQGYSLAVQDLFSHATVRRLATLLTKKQPHSAGPQVKRTPFALLDTAQRDALATERDDLTDAYPLSRLQAGMVFHAGFGDGDDHYLDLISYRVALPYQAAVFEQSWQRLHARHAVLRTDFQLGDGDAPFQRVHRQIRPKTQYIDLRGQDEATQNQSFERWQRSQAQAALPFDQAPLLRVTVHHLDNEHFRISLLFHHSILDGWSVGTLWHEWATCYRQGLQAGAVAEAAIAADHFRDFIALEQQALANQATKAFWKNHLHHFHFTWPDRLPRPAEQHHKQPAVLQRRFDADLLAALQHTAAEAQVPLKTTLLAGYSAALAEWCGQTDITFGFAVNGRPDNDDDNGLGLFLNMIPLRPNPVSTTWSQLLDNLFQLERNLQEHRRYPLPQIQLDVGHTRLFETAFNFVHFHNMHADDADTRDLWQDGRGFGQTHFALMVNFVRDERGLSLVLDYDAAAVHETDASAFAESIRRLLNDCAQARATALARAVGADNDLVATATDAAPVETEPDQPWIAPEGPIESQLCDLFAALLQRERVGALDNFFELGGHSISAIQLAARVRRRFGRELSMKQLYAQPNPRALARLLTQLQSCASGDLPERDPASPIKLSFTQERLWFMNRFDPDSAALNMGYAQWLFGELNADALDKALNALVQRHDILRTVIEDRDGKPEPVVQTATPLTWSFIQQSGDPEEDEAWRAFTARLVEQPYDLTCDLPLRAYLIQATPSAHMMLLVIHHVAGDGWSIGLLLQELHVLYDALRQGQTVAPNQPLAPPRQFADVAAWQRDQLTGAAAAEHAAFWRETLADVPALELPTDFTRPHVLSQQGGHHQFIVPEKLRHDLAALAQREGVTLATVLLAAWQVLLARYARQNSFCLGMPSAGRTLEACETMVGPFANTLLVRAAVAGHPDWSSLIHAVHETLLTAFLHEAYPFDRIVEDLAIPRETSRHPVYQAMFNLQNNPADNETYYFGDLRVRVQSYAQASSQVDVSLDLYDDGSQLWASLEYATDLFTAATMEHMSQAWQHLLTAMCTTTNHNPLRAPLCDPNAVGALINSAPISADKPVPQVRQALQRAIVDHWSQPALYYGGEHFQFGQLWQATQALIEKLGPQQALAVPTGNRPATVIAYWAAVLSGRTLMPLDPSYPADRLRAMLADHDDVQIVAVAGEDLRPFAGDLPIVIVTETAPTPLPEAPALLKQTPATLPADQPAYIIFTSGTTGKPKGVLVPQRAFAGHLAASGSMLNLRSGDRVLQFCALGFDISLEELFPTWCAGAVSVFCERECREDFAVFNEMLHHQAITHLNLPTQFWQNWVEHLQQTSAEPPSSLRSMVVGGEQVGAGALSRWRGLPGTENCEWHNGYGPTETAITATVFRDQGRDLNQGLPIGTGLAHVTLHVLDPHLQPVALGMIGELYIGGAGVALGYLKRPQQTAEAFIPDPWSAQPGVRMYRSGDLVRLAADGCLLFAGRADNQFKIRGYRIELGEIEQALLRHPAVPAAVVAVHQSGKSKQLAAWAECNDPSLDAQDLRDYLGAHLPRFMLPHHLALLEVLPKTANGKIDRASLTIPREPQTQDASTVTAEERRLAEVWSSVLEVDEIQPNANFFDLGGDSIMSIQLVARARAAGFHLSVRDIFNHQTVRAQVALTQRGTTHSVPGRNSEPLTGSVALTPIQIDFFQRIDHAPHHWNQSVFLAPGERLCGATLAAALHDLITHHDALRLVFPDRREGRLVAPCEVVATDLVSERTCDDWGTDTLAPLFAAAQSSLDLCKGPLFRGELWSRGNGEQRLLLVAHHLIVDGVSWRIITEDLTTAYQTRRRGEQPHLPARTSNFRFWSETLQTWAKLPETAAQADYWLDTDVDRLPLLPVDHPEVANVEAGQTEVEHRLSAEITEILARQLVDQHTISLDHALIAALGIALRDWTGQTTVYVEQEGHGRETGTSSIDLSRTVGWFTSLYPFVCDIGASNDLLAVCRRVALRHEALPNHGFAHCLLRYLDPGSERGRRLIAQPRPQISFNNLGSFSSEPAGTDLFQFAGEAVQHNMAAATTRHYELDVIALTLDHQLVLRLQYHAGRLAPAAMQRLLDTMVAQLETLARLVAAGDSATIALDEAFEDGDLDDLLLELNEIG